jgi:hypothetical protein
MRCLPKPAKSNGVVANFSKASAIDHLECWKINSVGANFMGLEIPQNQVVGDT